LALRSEIDRAIERFALDEAITAIWRVIEAANRTLDQTAPWTLIKHGDLNTAGALLRELLETLHAIARELTTFLPRTAAVLLELLPAPPLTGRADWNALTTGAALPAALQLFPRCYEEPVLTLEPRTKSQTTVRDS
jgi:methionyl-tRNA synthetase